MYQHVSDWHNNTGVIRDARARGMGIILIVKPPTTQPLGLRSIWFRDPDGNILNFFASVAGGWHPGMVGRAW